MQTKGEKTKIIITKVVVILSFLILSTDFIYKTVRDITSYTKEKCILYLSLPKTGFLIYEYFLELLFVVVIGVFCAVVLEAWFSRFKKFYPKNPFTAFLYASVIPVCSCTTIPIVKSMEDKISFRTLISFIISAPLLSPYIIVLSFSVLGFKYGVLRIVCSLILAILTGLVVEFFYKKDKKKLELSNLPTSKKITTNCPIVRTDKFLQTYNIMKSIFPFLILAGGLGVVAELYVPVDFLEKMNFGNHFFDLAIVILIGIPMYYCNGADVILLKPLIAHSGLSLGTAMAFSLTSTSICITAIIMLIKFLNKKLTMILIGTIAILTFIIGFLINTFL
jgi:uncharacterized membrane protein YraQ (UPF0718 family)